MKYIIDIEEKPLCVFDKDTHTYFPRLWRVKGFNSLVFDEEGLSRLEELNSDYINEHFGSLQDTAYQRGLEDGKQTAIGAAELREKLEYQKGFKDGKAQSENGCEGCRYERRTSGEKPCVYCSNNFKNHWTAKQTEEIKVGDEVEHNSAHDIKVLVTDVDEEEKLFGGLALTTSEHNCDIGDRYSNCQFKRWHKTGRHFDIDKILEEIAND